MPGQAVSIKAWLGRGPLAGAAAKKGGDGGFLGTPFVACDRLWGALRL